MTNIFLELKEIQLMKNKLHRPLLPIVCAIPLFLLLITSCSKLEYQVIDKNSKILSEMQQDKPYIIGCGDRMKINVWRHEELSLDPVVMPDGEFSLPLIGEIHVAGLTVEELKNELNRKFAEYISEPHVTVTIIEINSFKIYIIGEVTKPGELKMVTNTDVLQAIAMAGGFTTYAGKDNIKIFRREGDKKIQINFNYEEVIKGKNLKQNIPLKSGDVIIVPESNF